MANLHVHQDFGRAGAETPFGSTVSTGLRAYLLQVYNYMAAGLILTGAVAYYGAVSGFYASIVGTPLFWIILFSPLALVLFLGFRIERISLPAAQISFWAYAGLVGLSLSGIFLVYTGESIARVFFICGGTFAATSLYGYATRRDLSRFGSFLFMGRSYSSDSRLTTHSGSSLFTSKVRMAQRPARRLFWVHSHSISTFSICSSC